MIGSTFLEVAMGLIFVYVLLSLVCSGIQEIISQLAKLRADTMRQGIGKLINDPQVKSAFYNHPLIKSLAKEDGSAENANLTYIPSSNFAMALLGSLTAAVADDEQAGDQTTPAPSPLDDTFKQLEATIDSLPAGSDLKKSLSAFLITSEQKVDKVQKDVENWFNSVMGQASEWYRKKAQLILFIVALIVTGMFNADSIQLTTSLWNNPTLRQGVAEAASAYVARTDSLSQPKTIEAVQEQIAQLRSLETLNLPLGWTATTTPDNVGNWILKIIGLLFTAFAAAQGAPFWFDLLKKITNRRS